MKIIYFSAILILLFFMMLSQMRQFRNIDEFVPVAVDSGPEKIELLPPNPNFLSTPADAEIPPDSLRMQPKITACFLQTQPH